MRGLAPDVAQQAGKSMLAGLYFVPFSFTFAHTARTAKALLSRFF
jgi:hypothetical protein